MRPRAARARLPGHREPVKEDLRGIGDRQRGRAWCCWSATPTATEFCRLVSRANLAGAKSMPWFTQALLAENVEGLVATGGPDGEIGRRLRVGDRAGARKVAEGYARRFDGFYPELQHHLLPDDDWLVAETAALAGELGLPVVVTNDVHYARPEGRELHDVLTADHPPRPDAGDPGRPSRCDSESYLKSGDELAAMALSDPAIAAVWWSASPTRSSWRIRASSTWDSSNTSLPASRFRAGRRRSRTFRSCADRCPPALPPADVGRRQPPRSRARRDRAGRPGRVLPDLLGPDAVMRERGHPGPGPGKRDQLDRKKPHARDQSGGADPAQPAVRASSSTRAGRPTRTSTSTSAPSAGKKSSSACYERYGEEHTGMVCNLVTYRARSAVREVGYALWLSAATGRPGGEGARDVRQRHGPARPGGRRWLRGVLQAARGVAAARTHRGPWPDRRDGPVAARARRADRDRRCQRAR